MSGAQVGLVIQASSHDPPPSWGTLWILFVSHGSLTFVGLSRSDLHSLSHPPTLLLLFLHLHPSRLCWCKGGDIPNIYGIMDLWVMGRRF